jgi:hypothetical protein
MVRNIGMPSRGDFPGLQRSPPRKDGSVALHWARSHAARKVGYPVKTVRLRNFIDPSPQLDKRCQELQAEQEKWLADQHRPDESIRFDGTFGSLIAIYETHEESPYQRFPRSSRTPIHFQLRTLRRAVGERRLDKLNGIDFRRWYREFRAPRKKGERISNAYQLIKRVRAVLTFGMELGLADAKRLREVLSFMEFAAPKSRTQQIEYQHASAFIAKAHELGEHELAMTQAFEFELMMRQTDVIGKWEDRKDLPDIHGWVNGLRWEEITEDRMLSHTTGKTTRPVTHDLNEYPLIRAELDLLPAVPRIGPLIIDHKTGRPFKYEEFARRWRRVARLAGIPDDVWNRDSRAGGVTEARSAGADKDDVREGAGHAQAATTDIYIRDKLEQTRRVARARVAYRKKQNKT